MNKKAFFFTICLTALTLIFTGCAKQEEGELKIETTEQGIQEVEEKELKVQETTKEVEEVEVVEEIQEEPEKIEEVKEISLPPQDLYWNLNYFDLNQYLLDCGAIISISTEGLGPDISVIVADFGDFYLNISTCNYEQVPNIYIGTTLPDTDGFYRDFNYDDDFTKINIIVNLDDGTMVHQASIKALPEIIEAILNFNQTNPGERPQVENCIYP